MLWEIKQFEVEFKISMAYNFYWIGIIRLHDDQDVHNDHDGVPRKVEAMECRVEADDHKEQKMHDMPDEVDEAPDCGPLFHMLENVNRKFKMFVCHIDKGIRSLRYIPGHNSSNNLSSPHNKLLTSQ